MGDFLYAFIQLIHNVGAAAVVGSPATAWWLLSSTQPAIHQQSSSSVQRNFAWLAFFAWSTQIASGAGFGATTYLLKHELPELTGVGFTALIIKVSCAVISMILLIIFLRSGKRWTLSNRIRAWQTLFSLGALALMSAAFLRWYS